MPHGQRDGWVRIRCQHLPLHSPFDRCPETIPSHPGIRGAITCVALTGRFLDIPAHGTPKPLTDCAIASNISPTCKLD